MLPCRWLRIDPKALSMSLINAAPSIERAIYVHLGLEKRNHQLDPEVRVLHDSCDAALLNQNRKGCL